MSTKVNLPERRPLLPKIMACQRKSSVEELRAHILFQLKTLDVAQVRRYKLPLYKCLIEEMKERKYSEAALFLEDLIFDNEQLIRDNDEGITVVVDLRKRSDYLDLLSNILQIAERAQTQGDTRTECLVLLYTALYFSNMEHGIYWLADKLFVVAVAVSSKYDIDGGRLEARCKFYYCKFLLDKFPGLHLGVISKTLTSLRDKTLGKSWLLYDKNEDLVEYYAEMPSENNISGGFKKDFKNIIPDTGSLTLSIVICLELFKLLCARSARLRHVNPMKAEAFARLAEKRARDAQCDEKVGEAILEIGASQVAMKEYKAARRSFMRAIDIFLQTKSFTGLCQTQLHLADVMQRNREYNAAISVLKNVNALAAEHNLKRYYGASLHIIGDLLLKTGHPELSTPYFTDAFRCFKGFTRQHEPEVKPLWSGSKSSSSEDENHFNAECERQESMDYEEHSEHSRLMAAVSAGQEHIRSYYRLLESTRTCNVAFAKAIAWNLLHRQWWMDTADYQVIPCECPEHNLNITDAAYLKRMSVPQKKENYEEQSKNTRLKAAK